MSAKYINLDDKRAGFLTPEEKGKFRFLGMDTLEDIYGHHRLGNDFSDIFGTPDYTDKIEKIKETISDEAIAEIEKGLRASRPEMGANKPE